VDVTLRSANIFLDGTGDGYDMTASFRLSTHLKSFLHSVEIDKATCAVYLSSKAGDGDVSSDGPVPVEGDDLVSEIALASSVLLHPQSMFDSIRTQTTAIGKNDPYRNDIVLGTKSTDYGIVRKVVVEQLIPSISKRGSGDNPLKKLPFAYTCEVNAKLLLYQIGPVTLPKQRFHWRRALSTADISTTATNETRSTDNHHGRAHHFSFSTAKFSQRMAKAFRFYFSVLSNFQFTEPRLSANGASVTITAQAGLNAAFLTFPVDIHVPKLRLGVGPQVQLE
jgi:hypothetical protein